MCAAQQLDFILKFVDIYNVAQIHKVIILYVTLPKWLFGDWDGIAVKSLEALLNKLQYP